MTSVFVGHKGSRPRTVNTICGPTC